MLERRVGYHLPQSGRSIQRRWRGPLVTRSGDGSEGGARGRLLGDCDSAFNIRGCVKGENGSRQVIDEKKEMKTKMNCEEFFK